MGTVSEDNSDGKDEMTIVIVSDSYPYVNLLLVSCSNIIGTVTEEDNSDKEDMEIVVSRSQYFHGNRLLESYPDSDSEGEPCILSNNRFLTWILTRKLI